MVRSSLALCSSVYVMISLFGFLLFGDATLDDVLANFDTNLGVPFSSLLSDVVRVSYAAHLMLVFPIVFFPLRLNLDGLLFPSARPLVLSNIRFAAISIGLIGLIFLGANFIPSIWDAFQFTGATAAVCIGFIFPAAVTLGYVTFYLLLKLGVTGGFRYAYYNFEFFIREYLTWYLSSVMSPTYLFL